MSAYTPGPSGQGPHPSGTPGGTPGVPGPVDALLAARQELSKLRDVFESIHDALIAALTRVEALEMQIGTAPRQDDDGSQSGQLKPARTVAEWKMAGWTPATSGVIVTGESLRARREALGISQAAVAHAAHCSRGLVAEVERGKRRSAQTLAHLSNTLDRLEQQARRN